LILKAGEERFLLRELPEWWPEVLRDEETQKILHNAKFDLMWMIEFCPDEESGQSNVANVRDTMLASQLAGRYRTRSGAAKAGLPDLWTPNDLQACIERYLGVTIEKGIDHDTTDWTGHWSDDMIAYMLEDIDYLEPLHRDLEKAIDAEGQERAYEIECDVVFGTAWMTLNGMMPDQTLWKEAITGWRDDHIEVLKELQDLWPGVTNYNSPKQLVESSDAVLGGPLKSTKKAILQQMAPTFPAVAKLLEQRHIATRLKNWGPTFLRNFICAMCGRFHPSWNQIGTETSRFSCSRPNCQQFPRDPEFRRMITALPGHVICSLDYSSIEVVAAAVFSQDKNLLEACRTGDPHLATAQMIAGDPTITKDDPRRQGAKIANFGLLFAGGAQGLVTQARDIFGVTMSIEEAQQTIYRYFKLYSGMKRERNMAYDRIQNGPKILEIHSASGRRRYLEGFNRRPTSILNTRIQTDAGDGIKRSFHYLGKYGLFPFLIGQVHDELLFEFPESYAEEGAKRAKACMLQGMYDILGRTAPVRVDTNIAACWT
jgi:DNA polymerase I-like protein with 3'-5' exonuclease and polymerase domains